MVESRQVRRGLGGREALPQADARSASPFAAGAHPLLAVPD